MKRAVHPTLRPDRLRDAALAIAARAQPIRGTRAEGYLHSLGIRVSPGCERKGQVGYIADLAHPRARGHFPALVAKISDDEGICAVLRIYLDAHENGQCSELPRVLLKGPIGKGAVRFGDSPAGRLGLADTVENALAASQLYGLPVWASLSERRFMEVGIPERYEQVCIFGNSGTTGRDLAFAAADYWERHGRQVEVYFPNSHFVVEGNGNFVTALHARRRPCW